MKKRFLTLKTFKIFLVLLFFSNNISIFIYGILQEIKAQQFYKKTQFEYIEYTSKILGLHEYEENSSMLPLKKEIKFNGYTFLFFIDEVDKKFVYLRLLIKKENKTLKINEYLIKRL